MLIIILIYEVALIIGASTSPKIDSRSNSRRNNNPDIIDNDNPNETNKSDTSDVLSVSFSDILENVSDTSDNREIAERRKIPPKVNVNPHRNPRVVSKPIVRQTLREVSNKDVGSRKNDNFGIGISSENYPNRNKTNEKGKSVKKADYNKENEPFGAVDRKIRKNEKRGKEGILNIPENSKIMEIIKNNRSEKPTIKSDFDEKKKSCRLVIRQNEKSKNVEIINDPTINLDSKFRNPGKKEKPERKCKRRDDYTINKFMENQLTGSSSKQEKSPSQLDSPLPQFTYPPKKSHREKGKGAFTTLRVESPAEAEKYYADRQRYIQAFDAQERKFRDVFSALAVDEAKLLTFLKDDENKEATIKEYLKDYRRQLDSIEDEKDRMQKEYADKLTKRMGKKDYKKNVLETKLNLNRDSDLTVQSMETDIKERWQTICDRQTEIETYDSYSSDTLDILAKTNVKIEEIKNELSKLPVDSPRNDVILHKLESLLNKRKGYVQTIITYTDRIADCLGFIGQQKEYIKEIEEGKKKYLQRTNQIREQLERKLRDETD